VELSHRISDTKTMLYITVNRLLGSADSQVFPYCDAYRAGVHAP
jgi:hypothetical protein